MPDADVIVIGSGPAGAHAADTLVRGGAKVLMLDGGNKEPEMPDPGADYLTMRAERSDQWRWFLGEDLSGIPIEGLTGGLGGGQVGGNRSYTVRDAGRELPLELENAFVIQSLGLGGLGAAWGATCAYLGSDELAAMGLPPGEMEAAYDDITKEIGVSGPATRPGIDPSLRTDHHAENILKKYEKNHSWFRDSGLAVTVPHAAVLTKDRAGRKATSYGDMEYWANDGKSVYRPQFTVEALRGATNFTYIDQVIVERFDEEADGIRVTVKKKGGGPASSFSGKKLLLAAGAVGSARILLRSLGLQNRTVPFVGKHHVFSACVDFRSLGDPGSKNRTSLCQLLVVDQKKRGAFDQGVAQLYSYRSLQLFRLLSSLPLPAPEALKILSILSPSLVIADIRFPAFPSAHSTLLLKEDGIVRISASVTDEERALRQESWKRLRKAFRKLGIPSVRNLWLPEASSSHYGGTVPVSDDPALQLSADTNGHVRQLKRVTVADASLFRCLPGRPHTLTLMANARRIARNALAEL